MPDDHQHPCQTVNDLRKDLKDEINARRNTWWKILSAVLVIIFGFGSCTSSLAMFYVSKSGDKMDSQRELIDANTAQYQKMNGVLVTMIESQKEQREEQKKLVEAVHRVEVIVAKTMKTP